MAVHTLITFGLPRFVAVFFSGSAWRIEHRLPILLSVRSRIAVVLRAV